MSFTWTMYSLILLAIVLFVIARETYNPRRRKILGFIILFMAGIPSGMLGHDVLVACWLGWSQTATEQLGVMIVGFVVCTLVPLFRILKVRYDEQGNIVDITSG